MMYDKASFEDTVTGFAATLERQDDADAVLAEFLERISAVHELMGSAVTVAVDGVLQFPAAASSSAAFARLERNLRIGPCAEAFDVGEPVTFADLRRESQRWPDFASDALKIGVLAGASMPLRFEGELVGALNLYADDVRAWPAEDLAAARVLADMASVYLNSAAGFSSRAHRAASDQHGSVSATRLLDGWSGRAVVSLAATNIGRGLRRDRSHAFPAGAIASWSDVSRARRCGGCQSVMAALVGGTDYRQE